MSIEVATETDELHDEERLKTNLAALKTRAPHLHARLSALRKVHAELLIAEDGSIDLALMGQRFYGGDAAVHAQRQLDTFFAKPLRNYMNRPDPSKLKGTVGDFCKRMERRMAVAGMETKMTANPDAARFLVLFGVGLGCHVAEAIERSDAKVVILIEPNLEVLHHSLRVVDWDDILQRAGDAGRNLHFMVDSDAAHIAANVCNIVRRNNPALLDGTYLYMHYPSSILAQAYDMVRRDLYLTLTGLGYFEDEIIMTENAAANIGRGGVRVLSQYLPKREEPFFVVGSGPSVEKDLPFLRAHADRAVICSIGTSLRAVLAAGIRPDFHVEVENTEDTADALAASCEGFNLDGVRLLGSLTVHPRVAATFFESVLFFRERISTTKLLGGGFEPLRPSGRTVANAALSGALRLGFREIYLFGIDMGTKVEGRFHAADTIYETGALDDPGTAAEPHPGNFGGESTAINARRGMPVLNWSRHMFESLLTANPSITVYNCSDGTRIAGTIPKVSRAVVLPEAPIDRERLAREVDAGLTPFGPQLAARRWSRSERDEEARAIFDQVIGLIDGAAKSPAPDPIFDIVRPDADAHQVTLSYLSGSMMLLLGCATWYERHMADDTQRARYAQVALEEMGASVRALRDGMARLFDAVDAQIGELAAGSAAAE